MHSGVLGIGNLIGYKRTFNLPVQAFCLLKSLGHSKYAGRQHNLGSQGLNMLDFLCAHCVRNNQLE
ncbi:hypothetical protein D3C73_1258890 [compost metagenome]